MKRRAASESLTLVSTDTYVSRPQSTLTISTRQECLCSTLFVDEETEAPEEPGNRRL